jgi:hypothetical protein
VKLALAMDQPRAIRPDMMLSPARRQKGVNIPGRTPMNHCSAICLSS